MSSSRRSRKRRNRRSLSTPSLPPHGTQRPGAQGGGERGSSASTPGTKDAPRPATGQKKPKHPRDLSSLLSYGPTYIPVTTAWTDNRIEQVRAFKNWVYVAVNKIAETISAHPPNVSYVRGHGAQPISEDGEDTFKNVAGRHRFLPHSVKQKALTPLQAHEELEAVPDNHPLLRLLKNPNDPDVSADFWYETILFLLLTGNCYWWMPRNRAGLPCALWVVPSHWVWPIMGKTRTIEAYEVRPIEGNYVRRELPPEDVIHFRLKNPISKIDGFGPLIAGANWADTDSTINRARSQSYRNGPLPHIAVEFDSNFNDPGDDTLRRIEAKWLARLSGQDNAGRPIFIPPGMKVKPLTIEPNKMLFGPVGDQMRDNILGLFGVPVAMVNSTNMTYGGQRAAQYGFYSETVNPKLHFLGQVITEKLAWRYDSTLRVWWEDKSPSDPEVLDKRITTAGMFGAITPNQIRNLYGWEPLPYAWADQPVLPANMQATGPMGGANASGKPPKPGTPSPHVSEETFLPPAFSTNGHSHPRVLLP